jgi:hypothetical protein
MTVFGHGCKTDYALNFNFATDCAKFSQLIPLQIMGTWGAAIESNDTFLDIYSAFFDLYNKGQGPAYVSSQVTKTFIDEFEDPDTKNNALFALALAQWETKAQDAGLLNKVEGIIAEGKDLEVWKNLGADQNLLKERKNVLDEFLSKISKPIEKAKRRVKPKFVFENINLVKITSPDGLKTFTINKEYVNGSYVHTSSGLMWDSGGGSILYFTGEEKKVDARWIDSQTLEVTHDSDIRFDLKHNESYYMGDMVYVVYIAVGDTPALPPLLSY